MDELLMGGYRHQPKLYRLTFEDYPGLEVTVRSVSTGRLMKLMRMAIRLQDKDVADASELTAEDADALDALFSGFAKALVSWNLEDDEGRPVPATLEGVQDQEFDFVFPIINQWIEVVAGTPGDLGKGSNSGQPFPEVSLPMAPLSPSRSN